jgi:cell division cycle 2-like protein
LPPYLPAIQGCRSVEEFQWLNRIEEGTYGVVYRAKDKRTGEILLRFGSMVYYETPSDI